MQSETAIFTAQITGGIQGFREPRPAIVFVTSAGVERNAKIGDDESARKKDIPIVQVLSNRCLIEASQFESQQPQET